MRKGFFARMALAALVAPAAAVGAPEITRSPAIVPPTGSVTVRASGFCPSEAVDFYLGSTLLTVLASNAKGDIGKTKVAIPANTPPGKQALTAAGQKCNDAASIFLSVFDDWSQAQFDGSGASYNYNEGTISAANVGSLSQLWVQTGGGFGPLAVEDDDVYLSNQSSYAYDAFNGQTGALLWSTSTGPSMAAPALSASNAFLLTETGYLFGVSRHTGALKWTARPNGGFVPPLVVNGTVFVADQNDSIIVATDAASGSPLWSYSLPQSTSPDGLAVVGGVVYVPYVSTTQSGGIIELDAATGSNILAASVAKGLIGPPVVANSRIYISDFYGGIDAFDAATGAPVWSAPCASCTQETIVLLSAANDIVYASQADAIVARNGNDGTVLWTATTGGTVSTPSIANGIVYVTSNDGNVYAYDAKTGTQLLVYNAALQSPAQPVIADGKVFISDKSAQKLIALSVNGVPPEAHDTSLHGR